MSKTFHVAVVGATGLVGREMLALLEERGFPLGKLTLLASTRSAGEIIEVGGENLTVRPATPDSFAGVDVVLMSAGREASATLAPAAAKAGAVVIDNSSCWRMDEEVPLVVPEVNAPAIAGYAKRRILANPNCSTIQMLVAVAPLHRKARLKRIVCSTYQAVSGKGKAAMDELGDQVTALFNGREAEVKAFPHRIAFNCLPHIDSFESDGFTKEEHKMVNESRKILGHPALGVCATCVRVPVFNGHAISLTAEFEEPLSPNDARALLREAPGVMLIDEPAKNLYPMQLDADGSDATLVGRVRQDPSTPNSLAMWVVADNLRKGAATNAVQIAEILVRDYLRDRARN